MDGPLKKTAGIIRFDFEKWHKIAQEVHCLTGVDTTEFVRARLNEVVQYFANLSPYDFLIVDAGVIRTVTIQGHEYTVEQIEVGLECPARPGQLCAAEECARCGEIATAAYFEGQEPDQP